MDTNEENCMKSKFGIYFLKRILKILLVDLKVKIENCSWFPYNFGKYSLNRIKLFCIMAIYVKAYDVVVYKIKYLTSPNFNCGTNCLLSACDPVFFSLQSFGIHNLLINTIMQRISNFAWFFYYQYIFSFIIWQFDTLYPQ